MQVCELYIVVSVVFGEWWVRGRIAGWVEHVKEVDNVVDVAILAIQHTDEALGHRVKSGSPEGSVFTNAQDITVSGPPSLFLG